MEAGRPQVRLHPGDARPAVRRGGRHPQEAPQRAGQLRPPLDGKPIDEAGLPDYEPAQSFAKATQAAFPEGTQFTAKVRREPSIPDDEPGEIPTLAMVETRFVKGGMTGRNTRSFLRDRTAS